MEQKQIEEILNKAIEIVGAYVGQSPRQLKSIIFYELLKEYEIEDIRQHLEYRYEDLKFSDDALEEIYNIYCEIESQEVAQIDAIDEAYRQWKEQKNIKDGICVHCIDGGCELCIYQECDGEDKYCGKYEEVK